MHAIAQDATRIRHKKWAAAAAAWPRSARHSSRDNGRVDGLMRGAKTDAATARPLVLGVRLVVSCAGLWWRHKLRSALRLVQNERLI